MKIENDQRVKVKIIDPIEELKITVKDKQGNEYFCKFSKASFSRLPDDHPVEVFDENAKSLTKFVKRFLTVVKDKSEQA